MAPKDDAELAEFIDFDTFSQILEMDDDVDDREFSRSIVYDFFQQAEATFDKMDASIDEKQLQDLKALGHFLKGSSATLGITALHQSCEKIEHYGAGKDDTGTRDQSDDECLKNAARTIKQAKKEFNQAENALRKFYEGAE